VWGRMVRAERAGSAWQMLLYDLCQATRILFSKEKQILSIFEDSPPSVIKFTVIWTLSEDVSPFVSATT